MRSMIPGTLTILNMVCGFFSIMMVARGETFAGVAILLLAFFFDLLDGMVARRFGWTSEIGVQLDSLADAVSFVIAPAFIVYSAFFGQTVLGMVVAFHIAAFGIIRLARFNVAKDPGHFIGMSTPYFTTIVIGVYFMFTHPGLTFPFPFLHATFWIMISSLMISKIRFPSLKEKEFTAQKTLGGAILFLAGIGVFTPLPMSAIGIGMQAAALFLLFPLLFRKTIRRKSLLSLYIAAFIAASVLANWLAVPEMMIGAPLLSAVLLSPLVQLSMEP